MKKFIRICDSCKTSEDVHTIIILVQDFKPKQKTILARTAGDYCMKCAKKIFPSLNRKAFLRKN